MQSNISITIGKKDVYWNYLATFLQIGIGVLLFPLILRKFSSETVGVWSIFMTVTSLVALLDFGFAPSFTRNITYIFSGVNKLEKHGISEDKQENINYELLGNTIHAMRWLYARIALVVIFILISIGSFYLYHILQKSYIGNKTEIGVAWLVFCLVNTYNIYTLYYDSLVMGCGKVMRNKQIIIIGQLIYFFSAILFIYLHWGLTAIVSAQAISLIIKRFLSYRTFFTPELKEKLSKFKSENHKEIIEVIVPNSVKLGLTDLGSFFVLQSSVIIGSLYLSLEEIASYGITVQLVNVVSALSAVYFFSYVPRVSHLRVQHKKEEIMKIYLHNILIILVTFLISTIVIVFWGNWTLTLLKSQTHLLSGMMIVVIMFIALLERNHAVAGGFLLTKNEVPFFKASLVAGLITIILAFIFIKYLHWGLWGMILAPGIAQGIYQNWKWPMVLYKELKY